MVIGGAGKFGRASLLSEMYVVLAEFLKVNRLTYIAIATVVFFAVVALMFFQGVFSVNPLFFSPLTIGHAVIVLYMRFAVFFVVVILTIALVNSEFSTRTIGLVVGSSGRRHIILLAKFSVIFLVTLLAGLVAWLASYIPLLFISLTPLVELGDGSIGLNWYTALGGTIVQYLRALPMIALYVAFTMFVAILSKSRLITVVCLFLVLVVDLSAFGILRSIGLDNATAFFPTGWVNIMLAGTSSASGPLLDRVAFDRTLILTLRQLIYFFAVGGLAVALYVAASFIFNRRDITES